MSNKKQTPIDISNMTPRDREKLATQYQPLVHKIANQWKDKLPLSSDDIIGFAEEGLVIAMNTFNPDKKNTKTGCKSKQSFQQYAAWCMLHSILNGSNNQGHIIKLSAYYQNKIKEKGDTTFLVRCIGLVSSTNGTNLDSIMDVGEEDPYIGVYNIYDRVCDKIESKFSARDCDVFYRVMGLRGRDIEKGKDVAKIYGIKPCTVTLIVNKIVSYIKEDKDMCEELEELIK